ncbi:chromate efflux transporter [Rhodocytophaga rosea]|uniref:Chromate efflux transporter n=1 Tax=Rhodocytophaga rosea TaxID=2704465 RepID=A0A6C0GLZ2_9BACT|nr:chromate efflux transporter [Rhodocytophaga rosea]QHT69045.1 chromate efflux transporter [Rhodocytophaga rosea]
MTHTLPSTRKKPSFREATLFWLKLGFISFGGPAGQIAIMHEFLVDQKKWISDAKFLHALNYCMLLPGPEAQQLATYIGWLLHGTRGGLVAGALFVLPSVFILLGLSTVYVTYGNIPWVYALFYGLKPAVVVIVILALIKIGKKSLLTPLHYSIAALSFIGIFFLNIPFPWIILATLIIGFAAQRFLPSLFIQKGEKEKNTVNEAEYFLNSHTIVGGTGFNSIRLAKQLITGLVLWLIPFGLFYYFTSDFAFWRTLSLFFTQAAFITFGGAYAVLPYVAQVSVEQLHWLSQYEMIDGLALGETTPGPLIMVLAFVGFMAGFNHFGHSAIAGTIGLLTTTFYTFLPCFLFIFIGAPVIERTQHNPKVKAILGVVTAAVVGVVLNLTVYFGKAVVFPQGLEVSKVDYFSLIWIIISFVAMYRFKINMIIWIGISALAGLVHYLVI